MSLYEKYKRYKAGKVNFSIKKIYMTLFNLDFTEEQIMAISDYDRKLDILYTSLIIGSFIFGIVYGYGL